MIREPQHRRHVFAVGYCFTSPADPRWQELEGIRNAAGRVFHGLVPHLSTNYEDDLKMMRVLLKVCKGQPSAAERAFLTPRTTGRGMVVRRRPQAIRIYLTYRGATHNKVVQRHRGYKYLKQLVTSHLVRDKAQSRFLFGACGRPTCKRRARGPGRHPQGFLLYPCAHVCSLHPPRRPVLLLNHALFLLKP